MIVRECGTGPRFPPERAHAILATMPRDLPPSPRHQRADGAVELAYAASPRGTVLRHLYQQAPLRLLFPDPEPDEPPLVALVNCAGGLAGGDSSRVALHLHAGARATLATAAAEKIYRSLGAETRVETGLRLGPGACLEWLPQETILFDGARLARQLHIEMAEGASVLAAEILVFGRRARGETMQAGTLFDAWRLDTPAGPFWRDAVQMEGALGASLAAPLGFAGAEAMAMLLLAGPGAEAHLHALRTALEGTPGAATIPRPGLLLARWLGGASVLRQAVGNAIIRLRQAALGLPPRLPRLWST
jgi:urease accessory protein